MNKKIEELVLNERNPRKISQANMEKLKKSLTEFPEMLNLRPVVITPENLVLGGNMRVLAAKALGYTEIPVIVAKLTKKQQKEFIAKDNASFGEWDWSLLLEEYGQDELIEWAIEVPNFEPEVDYSLLEDFEEGKYLAEQMAANVKKAIQIEFEAEHYDQAFALVKYWREKGAYVGGMIIEHLKNEKEKL